MVQDSRLRHRDDARKPDRAEPSSVAARRPAYKSSWLRLGTASLAMLPLAALLLSLAALWQPLQSAPATGDWPIVSTSLGRLRGSVLTSVDGRRIFSFRGVRYAQPPIGRLRFKPPLPVEKWEGILNATQDGNWCPAADNTLGNEDCLYMNIYTTKLPDEHTNPKRPVMIFLHPGAFYLMRGTSELFGPQYIMDEDIVLVTINYRLGALGYLSTGDSVLPGNNGFKDQVQALRWIKQNIASFGGDPDSVTLGGYSAGSCSTYLHMLSPMSHGLFHKGIAMSASFQTIIVKNPMQQAKKQARLMNCPDTTSQEIVNCLQTKDAQEIASSLAGFVEWGRDPMVVFGAVVEPDLGDNTERFLIHDPTEQFLAGNFSNIPLITGTNRDEFTWLEMSILANSSLAEDMSEHFERIAPISFLYERKTPNSRHISRELRKFYLHDNPITNENRNGVGLLYADSLVIFPVDRTAKIVSRLNTSPVYYYHFTYEGRYSWVYKPGTTVPYGVVHHDDLMYLFHMPVLFPLFNKTDPEYANMKRMTKMWANFVHTGNPTSLKNEAVQIDWHETKPSKQRYLEIGLQLTMKEGLYHQDRMTLWDRLFPHPSSANSFH